MMVLTAGTGDQENVSVLHCVRTGHSSLIKFFFPELGFSYAFLTDITS